MSEFMNHENSVFTNKIKIYIPTYVHTTDFKHKLTSLPSRLRCSWVMVASTPAACSPPITEILALGHMYRNLRQVNNQ